MCNSIIGNMQKQHHTTQRFIDVLGVKVRKKFHLFGIQMADISDIGILENMVSEILR